MPRGIAIRGLLSVGPLSISSTDSAAILRQAIRERASGRAGADDDVVISLLARRSSGGQRAVRGQDRGEPVQTVALDRAPQAAQTYLSGGARVW